MQQLLPILVNAVNEAMRIRAMEKNQFSNQYQQHRKRNVIAQLEITRGTPFYGFDDETLFIKVSLYNPSLMKTIATLFESGLIANQQFQVYEAHLPYLLQVR